jgi:hypothetical protein
MRLQGWFRRLRHQLPGWHVWYSSPGLVPGERWNAVPASADATMDQALHLPGRISARTPAELRALCRERYGWDDHCDTCGVLARDCGHRTPERKQAP